MSVLAWVSLAIATAFLCAVMAGAWITQRITGNAGWSDAFWSFGMGGAGVFLALVPLEGSDWPSLRQFVIAALVGFWSLRLAAHIAERSFKGKEDARYAQFREEWGAAFETRLFLFLMLQALSGALLLGSVLLASQNPSPTLRVQDFLAIAVLAAAILGEGLADRQLRAFKADPANKDGVCDAGLWGWSRHPNYFFEWMGWLAYPIFAIELSGDYWWGWLALTGPAFMYWLLVHVSGIPPLEAHMMRSRPEAFARYKARVSAFFPRPPNSGPPTSR